MAVIIKIKEKIQMEGFKRIIIMPFYFLKNDAHFTFGSFEINF